MRWAEWNGRYRDDSRRYWRGDDFMTGHLATRLAGSADLYQAGGRQPYHSINFVTSHDGFPMNDLVTYNHKHNEPNGEGNRDGDNNNYSYNYGVEGPTRRRGIETIRQRQIKNMTATLLLSQGVPMILMGDECRRTQGGNNNAYCQDNRTSWFNWKLVDKNDDMIRFCKSLIEFRRSNLTVRRKTFLSGHAARPNELPDISWYGADGHGRNWNADDRTLTCLMAAPANLDDGRRKPRHVLMMMNATAEARELVLPHSLRSMNWRLFVDTAAASPLDVYPEENGPAPPPGGVLRLEERSMLCFVAPL
jgi:glycogen operon protein